MMSDCMRYGIVGGCDEDCPVYLRGECDCEDEVKEMCGVQEIKVADVIADYDRAMKGIGII